MSNLRMKCIVASANARADTAGTKRDQDVDAADAVLAAVRERVASLRTPDPNLTGEGYADWVGYERALTDMLAALAEDGA